MRDHKPTEHKYKLESIMTLQAAEICYCLSCKVDAIFDVSPQGIKGEKKTTKEEVK